MTKVKIKQFKNKAKEPVAGLTPEHAVYDANGVRLDAKLGNVNLQEFRDLQQKCINNINAKVVEAKAEIDAKYEEVSQFTQASMIGANTESLEGSNVQDNLNDIGKRLSELKTNFEAEIYGETVNINKSITWEDGYVDIGREIVSSTLSKFSQPILLKAGEKLSYKTGSEYSNAVFQVKDATPVQIGDTLSGNTIINYQIADTLVKHVAENDMYIIISCLKASNEISFSACMPNSIIKQVIYDVSANNNGESFTSLEALLSSSNLSTLIPENVRTGGMSIRFKQTSSNKYVQYRLMADSFNTTVTNWQGVDDVPTHRSENLVKSGGVKDSVNNSILVTTNKLSNKTLSKNNDVSYAATYMGYFDVVAGHTYKIYVKSESLLTDGTVFFGLGDNGHIRLSGDAILNGYTWTKTATVSTNVGRIYIDMQDGNEGVPVFVSIQDVSAGYSLDESIFKFNEIDTKWYVSNSETGPIFNSSHSVTFSPIVACRKYDGSIISHRADIFNIVKTAIDGYQGQYVQLSYNTTDKTVTVNFDSRDNAHCTIYYNFVTNSYRFAIDVYDMQNNEIMVLDICTVNNGMTFKGKAGAQWTAFYNHLKLNQLRAESATKFYLSMDRTGACTAEFDDKTGTVVFTPVVSMRRFNGERGEIVDLHEKFVAAECTYNEENGLCTVSLDPDNGNITIYRVNGTYGVTRKSIYEIPKDAETVLHIARTPDTFYFYGGAAAIWAARYNYLKLQKDKTETARNTANKVITQFYRQYQNSWSLSQKKITLLHFSDIHGDEKNFKRIVQYVEERKSMLTDVICTGDIVNYQFSDGIDWWKNNIGDNKILMAIGNHEPLVIQQGTWDWFGKNAAECYNRYFSPFIDKWGVNYTQDICYYYKDYSDASIRLIVLDGMRWNNIKEDAAQEEWFNQQLNDAKEKNLHVIVASHFPPDASVGNKNNGINFDCWYTAQVWETEEYGLLNPKVADSIDSFQNNGGNFICYIGGHTHGDLFRPLKRYPNQLMVIVANASCYEHVNNAGCWYSRSESDNSQELFNLLNIDTENKILSIVRIGCCFDRYARHIGTISFDYENHKVLSQY